MSRYIVPTISAAGTGHESGINASYFRKSADRLADELMEDYRNMSPAERVIADQLMHE